MTLLQTRERTLMTPKQPNISGDKLVILGDWAKQNVDYPGLGERGKDMYEDYLEFFDKRDNLGDIPISYKAFAETFIFVVHKKMNWVEVSKEKGARNVTITNVNLKKRLFSARYLDDVNIEEDSL